VTRPDVAQSARRGAGLLTATMAVVLAGNTIATPILPAYRSRWQLSVSVTALLFAVYVVGVVVALILLGRLADAIGNRVVVLLAVLTCVAATVLALAASDPGWLAAARIVQGLAAGLVPGATAAALTVLVTAPTAARLTSLATTGGIAGGLLLGGALAGLGTAAVWLGQLVLLVPVTVWAALAVRRGRPSPTARWMPRLPVVPSEGRAEFLGALAGAAVAFAAMGLFAGLGPLLLGANHAGGAFAGAAVAAAAYLVSGGTQLARPHRAPRWAGGLAVLAGVAALAAAVPLASLPLLLASAVLVGAGNGLLFPTTLAVATRNAPPAREAGTTSTYYLALYAGIALPLLGLGRLADATSMTTAVQVFAVAVGLAALAVTAHGGLRPTT
jgi:predicted MFS family arabinose efflux permease